MSLGETMPTRRPTVVDHRAAVRCRADALEQIGELLVAARDRDAGRPGWRCRWRGGCRAAAGGTCLIPRIVTRPSIRPSMLWVGNDVNWWPMTYWSTSSSTVIQDGTITGFFDMTSPTSTPSSAWRACSPCASPRAAVSRNQPMSISQSAADRVEEEEVEDAEADQHDGEEAAGSRSRDGGRHPVLRPHPEEAAKDPAAVERERRDQVEDEQEQVDGREPLGDDDHQRRGAELSEDQDAADEDADDARSVTAGPIAATSISVLPVIQSPLIWATPPKSQSLMPSTVDAAVTREQCVAQLVSRERGDQEQRRRSTPTIQASQSGVLGA